MKMKVPLKFQLLLLATFTLYACESTQDLETTLIPEANKKAHQKTLANAKRCALTLSSLTDNRTSKTLVLHETNNESLSDPVFQWLSESLTEMNVLSDTDNKVSVNVSLERAFLKTLNDKISATVVLNVEHKTNVDTEFSSSQVYRGQSFILAETERSDEKESKNRVYSLAVKKAINQASQRVKTGLLHLCV